LDASELTGSITSHDQCTTGLPAESPITVSGTAAAVPEDAFLWLLVYAPNGKYYPQCNDAKEGLCGANYADGAWQVDVYLGEKGRLERFHLVLVTVDGAGNESLTETMVKWAASGDYAGLEPNQLPVGIQELDSIQVETAD
jgi:hypothetical protein